MTPSEHAEVWRRAAKVVAAMDPSVINLPEGVTLDQISGFSLGGSIAERDASAAAYRNAAYILSVIADEYEKAAAGRPIRKP